MAPDPPPDQRELVAFYEDAYSAQDDEALLYARWRALGAEGKADHVTRLCAKRSLRPADTLEVGCGDGALLSALHARNFGGRLHGVEITQAAVDIAAGRPGIESVELYDGQHLPAADGAHELGIVSHVLEHVPDPVSLLRETARVCRAVVVEVPLEDNLSARRGAKRRQAREIGHIQALSREAMRSMIESCGLNVAAELEDPLPHAIHAFFARDRPSRLRARLKWLGRVMLHRLAPVTARRLFTLHYACLCLPRQAVAPAPAR